MVFTIDGIEVLLLPRIEAMGLLRVEHQGGIEHHGEIEQTLRHKQDDLNDDLREGHQAEREDRVAE